MSVEDPVKGWTEFEYFEPYWEQRTQRMAEFIAPGQGVVDIGCGEMKLRKYLPPGCSYVGVDCQQRDQETIVCDFNSTELPEIISEVYFVSGALEYAVDPKSLLKQICRNARDRVILSYCILEDFPHDVRGQLHWVSALKQDELVYMLEKNGFWVFHIFKVLGNTVFVANKASFGARIWRLLSVSKRPTILDQNDKQSSAADIDDPPQSGLGHRVHTLIEKVNGRWSYLGVDALYDLAWAVHSIESRGLVGEIIETGCALGGSAIVIAATKKKERPFKVYDAFGMIPRPSDEDGREVMERYEVISAGKSEGLNGEKYYGYEEDLLQKVKNNFVECGIDVDIDNIRLIKGLYNETIHVDTPVAMAHVDCDWYQSVKVCLSKIVPYLVVGGIIIVDDYHYYEGCRKAVDEYFYDKHDSFRLDMHSRLHIERLG